jgi:hypothetical protein
MTSSREVAVETEKLKPSRIAGTAKFVIDALVTHSTPVSPASVLHMVKREECGDPFAAAGARRVFTAICAKDLSSHVATAPSSPAWTGETAAAMPSG